MEQGQLFSSPDDAQPKPIPVDTEAIAAAGDRRQFDPNDRKISEAAIDQGWGPVEPADLLIPEPKKPRGPMFEMPGRNRGRLNPYDQPITPRQAQKDLTPEQVDRQQAVNAPGIALARAAIKNALDK